MSTRITTHWHGRIFILSCMVLLFSSMGMAPSLFAQTAGTGALTGTVKDSSGGVVPNVTVTLTSSDTAQTRTDMTDADGTYRFGLLAPGTYRVKFEAAGFGSVEVPSIKIGVTETSVLDRTLQVGQQTQQIEIDAGVQEAVQTTDSTVGSLVSSETMTAVPLTSRNYTNLLGLSAGANAGVFNAANLGRGSQEIAVNGSTSSQNNYSMDGASIVNFSSAGKTADSGADSGIGIVNPDAIEEFKIQTSLYDAGYGRKPGANVNVVTKSGTNAFHGTAFEFFRNAALNANDFFRKLSPAPNNTRQVLNQNQYGGTFGGPVKKDKLFFFVSYQETWQKNGVSPAGFANPTLVGIPQGDRSNTAAFKAALGQAFCPVGAAGCAATASTAPQTGLTSLGASSTQVAADGSNINQVALNILQLKNPDGSYLIPSSTTGKNQNTTFSIPAKYKEHQAIGNFDYQINSKNTLSGRWYYGGGNANIPMDCGANASGATLCLPGSPAAQQFTPQTAMLKLTSTLTNNVVNEARLSLQRFVTNVQNQIPFTDSQVGIKPIIPSVDILGQINVSGLFQFGALYALANEKQVTSWELADQISWSHGKHTFRAGFEYERDRLNWQLPGAGIQNLTFQTFQDFLIGLPGCAPGALDCAATTAAGLTNGAASSNISSSGQLEAVTAPGGIIHGFRVPAGSVFAQDDYKVTSNLTLNLGLRWEYYGLFYDVFGKNTNIWPSLINTVPVPGTTPATGTLAGFVLPSNFDFSAYPAPPVGGLYQNDKKIVTQNGPSLKNFAPRLGFAWKPLSGDRFVVRGGAGYFYDRVGQNVYNKGPQQNIPYAVPIYQVNAANYFSSFAQPYAQIPLGWTPRWANTTTGASSNLSYILADPNYLTPLTYEWNLNLQYEFASRWVLEVAYVGSRSIHQVPDSTLINQIERQINQAQIASPTHLVNGLSTNSIANASVRVPYLGFSPSGVGFDQTNSDSKYNSIQGTVRKQLSHGLQLQASYTYSRSFTTASFINFNDQTVPGIYGLNPAYRPQRLTINYSWDLPLGHHDGFVGKITNGWNLAGVTVVQNGSPLTLTDSRGGSIYGFGAGSITISTAQFAAGMSAANVASSGSVKERLGGSAGGLGYFNKAAFTAIVASPLASDGKATGWGNAGYSLLLGPGQFNFDTALQKTTKVGGINENATLVFRTEFFNMFNHPQFSNPTGGQLDVSKSTFGQITLSSVNPRLIQFALKYVF